MVQVTENEERVHRTLEKKGAGRETTKVVQSTEVWNLLSWLHEISEISEFWLYILITQSNKELCQLHYKHLLLLTILKF